MKILSLISLLATFLFTSCQTTNKATDFKSMEWLIGTWKGEANGQPFYENWTKINDTEFSNISFSVCNGDTIVNNSSKIEIRNNIIAYTSGDLFWELKSISDRQCVFENSHFGETFTFKLTDKNQWNAILKYPNSTTEYILSKTLSINDLLQNKPQPIEGHYAGYIEFNNKKLITYIDFLIENDTQIALATTPDNLQLNKPITTVCYNPPHLTLAMPDGMQRVSFNTTLNANKIEGTLSGELSFYKLSHHWIKKKS